MAIPSKSTKAIKAKAIGPGRFVVGWSAMRRSYL
jgi:hypothetical protein